MLGVKLYRAKKIELGLIANGEEIIALWEEENNLSSYLLLEKIILMMFKSKEFFKNLESW